MREGRAVAKFLVVNPGLQREIKGHRLAEASVLGQLTRDQALVSQQDKRIREAVKSRKSQLQ